MNSRVLYRRWRPQRFSQVVGQQWIVRTLINAVATDRVAHAYLFCGPRGTGKTSLARVLAKAVNCLKRSDGEPCDTCAICRAISEGNALDLVEIDAASNRGIDEIRSLREKAGFVPNEAIYKVYILDEAHMLTDHAFNALLKTLEEPPGHVMFILATTEPYKLPPTIISRCQRFDFRRLAVTEIQQRLDEICQAEGIEAEAGVLKLVAEAASGSLRDAENLLEQLFTYYGSSIGLSQAREVLGEPPLKDITLLVQHLLTSDVSEGIRAIGRIIGAGFEARQLYRSLLNQLRDLLLLKAGGGDSRELAEVDRNAIFSLAQSVTMEDVLRAIQVLGRVDMRQDPSSVLPLELALVEFSLGRGPEPISSPKKAGDREPERSPEQSAQPITAPSPLEKESIPRSVAPPALRPRSGEGGAEVLKRLVVGWRQVLDSAPAHIKRTNSMAFIRGSCRPAAVEGDTVVLEFKWPIHKENIEKPENRKMVEELVSGFLGASYRIRCVLGAQEPQGQPPRSKGHLVRAAMEMGAVPSAQQRSEQEKGEGDEQTPP